MSDNFSHVQTICQQITKFKSQTTSLPRLGILECHYKTTTRSRNDDDAQNLTEIII